MAESSGTAGQAPTLRAEGAGAAMDELAAEVAAEMAAQWFAADVATFGDRLAAAREAAGLSQDALAGRLGVRLATLQDWEEDRAEPRGNRLQMLAGLLNVSLSWLLTAEGAGLEAPGDVSPPLSPQHEAVLAELARLQTRASALAQEIGRVEKRLRQLLRQER